MYFEYCFAHPTILAPNRIPAANAVYKKWLIFTHVSGLIVSEKETIDGRGQIWWQNNCRTGTVSQNCITYSYTGFSVFMPKFSSAYSSFI